MGYIRILKSEIGALCIYLGNMGEYKATRYETWTHSQRTPNSRLSKLSGPSNNVYKTWSRMKLVNVLLFLPKGHTRTSS